MIYKTGNKLKIEHIDNEFSQTQEGIREKCKNILDSKKGDIKMSVSKKLFLDLDYEETQREVLEFEKALMKHLTEIEVNELLDFKANCEHKWKWYVGLFEKHEYCEKCDITKEKV